MTEPVTSVAALTIKLFGPIQVLVHGQPLPRLHSRKSLWLLALLTLRSNRPVEQANWLRQLEAEHDNLRATLTYSETEAQGTQAGLRLAGALYRFWNMRGDFSEGRASLGRALEREEAQKATLVRAKALNGAGALAYRQGDYGFANALNEEALTIQRALGDMRSIAVSLNNLGSVAYFQGNNEVARTLYEESLVPLHRNWVWNYVGAAQGRPSLRDVRRYAPIASCDLRPFTCPAQSIFARTRFRARGPRPYIDFDFQTVFAFGCT